MMTSAHPFSSTKTATSKGLQLYSADTRPIAQQISLAVVESRALHGVSKINLRTSFDEWCRSTEAASEQTDSRNSVAQSPNARYRFRVVIDRPSLESAKTRDRG